MSQMKNMKDIHYDHTCTELVNVRCGQDIDRSSGTDGCHVTQDRLDSEECTGFSFHNCATKRHVSQTITIFFHILTCSHIVHGRYKSIHHQGASCYAHVRLQGRAKWPKV
jgi:hypothetical protein